HPVIWQWFAIRCRTGQGQGPGGVLNVQPAEAWLQQLNLNNRLPNRAQPLDLAELEALRGPVVAAARAEMQQHQQQYAATREPELGQQFAEPQAMKVRCVTKMTLQLDCSSQAVHL